MNYDFHLELVVIFDEKVNQEVYMHCLKANNAMVKPAYCFLSLPFFYLEASHPFHNPTWDVPVFKFHHPMMTKSLTLPKQENIEQLYYRGSLEDAKNELIRRYENHQTLKRLEQRFD